MMRRVSGWYRWIVAGVVLACVVSCGEPPDDEGEPDELPAFEAHFNYPEADQPDETIERELLELIESASEDTTIRAAFYTFSRENVARAFLEADARGADVQVVLGNTNRFEDGTEWTAVQNLREGLGDGLTICSEEDDGGGCMGDNIHHNKFVTFSQLDDGSEDVVVQTSANITSAQLEQFNNMVVVRGDTPLYEAFLSYWEDLHRDETDLAYNRAEHGDLDTVAYFFPIAASDPVLDGLDGIDCAQGADVYLSVAFFTDNRVEVAQRLRQMDEQGCNVNAITRERDRVGAPGDEVISELSTGDIILEIFPEDDPDEVQLHSKYLAVDPHDQDPQVWTGSHNYTWFALRNNDEVLLQIRDDELFEAYRDDWYRIRDQAQPLHP